MEVSQIADLDNHAVVGGGKAQAFTMSESAEFFTVLSDTLYRDKKRAVVREIICNAWDAHRILGKNDPIEITLTDTEMRIRDFGPGIPHNKVGAIYCRYGASTKVKDDTQTGGFGLGSKAPFAYSSHFSVMNHHEGRRRVYAISRGGAETDGKPDFREMVNVPTEETGICVSIPLKSVQDRMEFENIIHSVVFGGGMRAKLNGVLIEGFAYDKATHGFCVVPQSSDFAESLVYCLYGTVLYPVVTTDPVISREVQSFGSLFGHGARIILIAPPNSVGVTPSRESLSYTDKTIETLKGLIAKKSKLVKSQMAQYARIAVKEMAADIAKKAKGDESQFFNRELTYEDINRSRYIVKPCMTLEEISTCAAHVNLSSLVKNQTKLIRLELAKHSRHHRSFLRKSAYGPMAKRYNKRVSNVLETHNPFLRHARLHIRLASKLGLLNSLYFGLVDGRMYESEVKKLRAVDNEDIPDRSIIKGKLYISFNHRDAITKMNIDRNKRGLGYHSTEAHAAIILNKKQADLIPKIIEMAEKLKMEPVQVEYTAPTKKKKMTEAEIAERNMFHTLDQVDAYGNLKKGAEATAEKADYYIRVNSDYNAYVEPSGFSGKYSEQIEKMFGKVLLVADIRSEQRLKAKGVKEIGEAAIDWLTANKENKSATYGAVRGTFLKDIRYSEVSQLIHDLCALDVKYSIHFFPPKDKKFDMDAAEKANLCLFIVDRLRRISPAKSTKEYLTSRHKEITEFRAAAELQYKDYFLNREASKERFGQYDILTGVQHYLEYKTEEDKQKKITELLEIFQYVDRKHKLKIRVRAKKEKEEALKKPIPANRALVVVNQTVAVKESAETVETQKEAA